MATASKRTRVEVIEPIDISDVVCDDDEEPEGMSSEEESDLDRQLENLDEESR